MIERRLVRVQEKGQVTLPAEVRRKPHAKKGDLVAVIETPEGVLITPQEVVAAKALDRIGEILSSVLIAASISTEGAARDLLLRGFRGEFQLVISTL